MNTLVGNGLTLSAHFCGWWAKQVLEEKNYSLVDNLHQDFKRVQLNYNFRNSANHNLIPLLNYANENPNRAIILQYNKSNAEILGNFVNNNQLPHNIHFLYDSSGGRGTEIERIDITIGHQYTGYAGGLNPDNVERICQMIVDDFEQVDTWIDLETGARTNDEFDLDKVRDITLKTSKFIINA